MEKYDKPSAKTVYIILKYLYYQTSPFDGRHDTCTRKREVTGALHGTRVGRSWNPAYEDTTLV